VTNIGVPDPSGFFTSPGTVSVLLGNVNGTFSAATPYATGIGPFSVAIGDLSGDGRLDLAVANYGNQLSGVGTISVLLGNVGGGFQPQTQYPTLTGFAGAQSVAIGDLNGDGKLDLAVADATNKVPILLGNGDGTFNVQTPLTFSAGTINNPGSIAIADLNGDGRLDLALANFGTSLGGSGAGTAVSVLLGKAGGGFNSSTLTTGTNPSSVAIGDLNGDGRLDLAVANAGSNTVSVLLGNGNGSFSAATPYATGANPQSVAIGDLNGDGRLDLAVANYDSNTVSVLLGNGNGSFSAATPYATGTNPSSVAIGDPERRRPTGPRCIQFLVQQRYRSSEHQRHAGSQSCAGDDSSGSRAAIRTLRRRHCSRSAMRITTRSSGTSSGIRLWTRQVGTGW
jgi:FG-GAP-like repeat